MLGRAQDILRKEFIHVFRDPRMRMMIFLMPVIQLLVFGYAATTDVRHVATAVCDLDNSVASRDLLARFVRSGYYDIVAAVPESRQAGDLLDHGRVQAILQINHGFGTELAAGRIAPLQVIVDGTDSNTAGIVLNYSSRIAAEFSRQVLLEHRARALGRTAPPAQVELLVRAWFNDNLESRNFYVPGVIAMIVMLITLMLTSMAVVREKEMGTMEQIMVTPITPNEFILGKTLPFAAIGLADVFLVAGVGVFWFDVPIRGNLLLLLVSAGLYLMTTLGIGLLISTVSQTQQQAMMSTFFFYLPAILLSGFMFPIANMPEMIQWLTCLNPLRYFLIIVRGIFLKGVGPGVLWPQLLALAIMGCVTLHVATRRFHKTFR